MKEKEANTTPDIVITSRTTGGIFHIEDFIELFVVKFLYNLLMYTLLLGKIPMILTKSRLWLDTKK